MLTYFDSHCCSVIQYGQTALDRVRAGKNNAKEYGFDESRHDKVIRCLEEFGK